MLSKAQEKLIRSLHKKKGRAKSGLCLVEGQKVIDTAGDAVDFSFTNADSEHFAELVTTETPQDIAAVARIPQWTQEDVLSRDTVVVLDNVQDPGNIGSLLRLGLGFHASYLFIESADPTSPKVVRSSVGALFQTPWVQLSRAEAEDLLASEKRPSFKLEKREGALHIEDLAGEQQLFLIAGSEGQGVRLRAEAQSLVLRHEEALESLNVTHAVAIALHERYK